MNLNTAIKIRKTFREMRSRLENRPEKQAIISWLDFTERELLRDEPLEGRSAILGKVR